MPEADMNYPSGWFAVATTDELDSGGVVTTRLCGEQIVVFRDAQGHVAALDAHCRHLGAHLGHGGAVEEGCLVCPFHGWAWNAAGECTSMPYGNRIPPAARTRSWDVIEQDDVILAWFDLDGEPPSWKMPSFSDARWTSTRSIRRIVPSLPQDILENSVDFAHFRFVHDSHAVEPVADPVITDVTLEFSVRSAPAALVEHWQLPEAVQLVGSTFCHGPGLTAARLRPVGTDWGVLQRLYVTPVEQGVVELRGLVNVAVGSDAEEAESLAEALAPEVFSNWDRDIEIWAHKRYLPRPVLNSTERGIPVFRRWYSTFYRHAHVLDPSSSDATAAGA